MWKPLWALTCIEPRFVNLLLRRVTHSAIFCPIIDNLSGLNREMQVVTGHHTVVKRRGFLLADVYSSDFVDFQVTFTLCSSVIDWLPIERPSVSVTCTEKLPVCESIAALVCTFSTQWSGMHITSQVRLSFSSNGDRLFYMENVLIYNQSDIMWTNRSLLSRRHFIYLFSFVNGARWMAFLVYIGSNLLETIMCCD